MRTELFRREVIEAKRDRVLGDVVYASPISYWLFSTFAFALAIAVICFAVWGEYTRKSSVAGYLAPDQGLIKVYAPYTGVVVKQLVQEGQSVEADAPLFILSMAQESSASADPHADTLAKLAERRKSLRNTIAAQIRIDRINADALNRDIEGMQTELLHLALEIDVQEKRVANAEAVQAKYQALNANQYAAKLEVQRQKEQILSLRAALYGLYRAQATARRSLEQARLNLPGADLKAANARAALEREIAELDAQITEQQQRRDVVIRAPRAGLATAVLAKLGQTLSADMPLLSILPEGSVLEAHLLVPSKSIGFVSEGQVVAIRYQAFPYQRFGSYRGNIEEIAKTLIAEHDTELPLKLSEPAYRVTVRLNEQGIHAYQKQLPLQAGMLLDADILLDRRPLYQWILDPLYSITRKS